MTQAATQEFLNQYGQYAQATEMAAMGVTPEMAAAHGALWQQLIAGGDAAAGGMATQTAVQPLGPLPDAPLPGSLQVGENDSWLCSSCLTKVLVGNTCFVCRTPKEVPPALTQPQVPDLSASLAGPPDLSAGPPDLSQPQAKKARTDGGMIGLAVYAMCPQCGSKVMMTPDMTECPICQSRGPQEQAVNLQSQATDFATDPVSTGALNLTQQQFAELAEMQAAAAQTQFSVAQPQAMATQPAPTVEGRTEPVTCSGCQSKIFVGNVCFVCKTQVPGT